MRKQDRIHEMAEIFGYDYAIGFCLCSEYDVRKCIDREEDEEKRKRLEKVANSYKKNADKLLNERMKNEL